MSAVLSMYNRLSPLPMGKHIRFGGMVSEGSGVRGQRGEGVPSFADSSSDPAAESPAAN